MKVVVFASDMPYPANRGGRADVWRRMLAMRALGHELMLVNLFEPDGVTAPTAADLATVDLLVTTRFSFPMRRGVLRTLRQLARLWWQPWHAATRMPDAAERVELDRKLNQFSPDLIWLEGPWFGPLVQQVAAARGLHFAYRSHNVEHQYLWRQANAAVRWRDQLAWRMACIGVRRLECRLMHAASAVFDISIDDMAFWRSQGVQRLHWLPPLPELAVAGPPPGPHCPGEVVFVGNLGTPNNVRGVAFLTGEVWPLVKRHMPAARLAIVGSNPSSFARECVARCADAELRENVAQPMAHFLGAKVLVNPVMTGSGVQLKTLDMMMTDVPIVSAAQGLRGLPPELAATVAVAGTAGEFASAICIGLQQGLTPESIRIRQLARQGFLPTAVSRALALAESDVTSMSKMTAVKSHG